MADKQPTDVKNTGETPAVPATPVTPPRRSPGHRGADVRDTVAEMAARAQEISQEAGSRMAAAMKDVINAAAGIADFAIESARDLAQYMVRRGQMTQEEADKLIREAEAAQVGRPQVARPKSPTPASTEAGPRISAPVTPVATPGSSAAFKAPAPPRSPTPTSRPATPAAKAPAPAAKPAPRKAAPAKAASKPAAKKPAPKAKKSATKKKR